MRTLKRGMRGKDVEVLQVWLSGRNPKVVVNGTYDAVTESAVFAFQSHMGLGQDGIFGHKSSGVAQFHGFVPLDFLEDVQTAPDTVARPKFRPLTQAQKVEKFGAPGAVADPPVPGGPITPYKTFTKKLVEVDLTRWFPQITGAKTVMLHKSVVKQFEAFFNAIALTDARPFSCAGAWVPRYIRGSTAVFSSHAFATAIDFDSDMDPLGSAPSRRSILRAAAANSVGLFWGGHFKRLDPMHFEAVFTDEEAVAKGFLKDAP